ncbi:hypothetical protein [Bartonella koehlerae]|uniref:Uncharacterized protein n=1 Tax=Bartonella koehlerae C-29 TaxID=1134510 RepID=A0A067W4E5_9HYPH|nr:hypothetical protein [Bartonella koehlerae]KEC54790.1 hypothetical protein O9A_01404 [Bartonella koehlerae C-29]
MIGGTAIVKNKNAALLAANNGLIDATNITLTTNDKGTGTIALGSDSRIELHGNTTINNTLNGLRTVGGGKIISEDLIVIGGKPINSDHDKKRTGVWTENSGSEIKLTGTTTIQNVDVALSAFEDATIKIGNSTIAKNSDSLDTKSKTSKNVIKDEIKAKKVALAIING